MNKVLRYYTSKTGCETKNEATHQCRKLIQIYENLYNLGHFGTLVNITKWIGQISQIGATNEILKRLKKLLKYLIAKTIKDKIE